MKVLCTFTAAAALVAGAAAATLYSTSFEANEGFAAGGDLNGQQGWIGNTNYDVVSGFAHSGDQSVRWSGTGGTYAWIDLAPPYTGALEVLSQVWIFIDPQTANDQRVFGMRLWGTSAGAVYGGSAGITLDSSGKIRAGDAYGELWDESSVMGTVANPTGRWIYMDIHYTPGAGTASVGVDTQHFNVAVATPRVQIDDIDLFSDWRDVNVDSTGYFDDYSVSAVPEPTSMAALGAGLALFARRRSRR